MGEQGVDAAGSPPQPAPAPEDPWASFDRWAGIVLVVMAGVVLVATLLVVTGVPGLGTVAVALLACGLATAAAFWLGWHGIAADRAWGRHVAYWLLILVTVSGIAGALVDFTVGKVTIPLGAFAAILVLGRKPGSLPAIGRRDRRIRNAIVATAIAGSLLPYPATWTVTDPASPFAAPEDDLAVSIITICAPTDTTQPTRSLIQARYARGQRWDAIVEAGCDW